MLNIKKLRRFCCNLKLLLLLSVVSLLPGLAAKPPPQTLKADFAFASLKKQEGVCLTILEDNLIEPIPFIVKNIIPNFIGPHKDVLLIKLLGERVATSGLASGMSGSPCYINDQLIGAIAYSFTAFPKEPVAGVTKIPDMLELLQLPRENPTWRLLPTNLDNSQAATLTPAPETFTPRPTRIATPLFLKGFTPEVLTHYQAFWQNLGLNPLAGGGELTTSSNSTSRNQTTPQPGSAVAILLMQGDLEIAAAGTVTWAQDGQVLAFGHPFLNVGPVSLPFASAEILTTISSQMMSFKLAASEKLIGEVVQDRLTGIVGVLGEPPQMVEVAGTIQRAPQETPKAHQQAEPPLPFRFRVARDLLLTPNLLTIGLANILSKQLKATDQGTIYTTTTFWLDETKEPLTLRYVYASARDQTLIFRAANDIGQAFNWLWRGSKRPLKNIRLQTQIDIAPVAKIQEILSIHTDRPTGKRGSPLEVVIKLQTNDPENPLELLRTSLTIPQGLYHKDLILVATDAQGASAILHEDYQNILNTKIFSESNNPDLTPQEISTCLKKQRYNGNLYLLLLEKGDNLHFKLAKLQALPPSIIERFAKEDPQKTVTQDNLILEKVYPLKGIVKGQSSLNIRLTANQ